MLEFRTHCLQRSSAATGATATWLIAVPASRRAVPSSSREQHLPNPDWNCHDTIPGALESSNSPKASSNNHADRTLTLNLKLECSGATPGRGRDVWRGGLDGDQEAWLVCWCGSPRAGLHAGGWWRGSGDSGRASAQSTAFLLLSILCCPMQKQ